jgi:hypothetical protein
VLLHGLVVKAYPHSFSAKFKALACPEGSVRDWDSGGKADSHRLPRPSQSELIQHMLRIFAEVNGTAGFREPEPTSLVMLFVAG